MIRDSAYLWIGPLVAMVVAQVLKPILIMLHLRRFDWARMRQSGGMPSSHTALVVALVVELWLRQGGHDAILGLALLLAFVVMYDAAGVRWQTGRHAAVLNRLLRDLQGSTNHASLGHGGAVGELSGLTDGVATQPPISSLQNFRIVTVPWWLMDWPILNEHVGHKPTEVLGGAIVGVLVALYLH